MNSNLSFLLAGGLCLTGCSFISTEPKLKDSQVIERDNSELVGVNLDLSGGDLKVAGGSGKLADLNFSYGESASKPEVHYSSAAGRGSLIIKQTGSSSTLSHTSKDWDLRFNQDVPLEMEVHLGGGDAHLDLGSLTLRKLDVDMGAGELDLNLRGAPKKNYEVKVRCGAGDFTIHLPSALGVDAQATIGIGDVSASGLHQEGHRYFNDALGKSPVTIHLDVHGDTGDIKLIAD